MMRRNDGWGLQMKEVWGLLVGVGLLCVPLSNAKAAPCSTQPPLDRTAHQFGSVMVSEDEPGPHCGKSAWGNVSF